MKIRKKDFEYLRDAPEDQKDIIREILDDQSKEEKIEVNVYPASQFKEEALEISKDPYKIRGVATGYPTLDKMLCGLDKGELVILAGETSVGKSLMAVNLIVQSFLKNDKLISTLFFSLEMPIKNILSRFLMIEPNIDGYPLYFYDNMKGANISTVRKAIQKLKDQYKVDLVVIDHLHYFPLARDNQAAEVGRITREIKQLAIEFDIPIILLAHLRRKMASSSMDKEPQIDDLKDSSSIGQDADIVIMLKRDDIDIDNRNMLSVFVRKNRNKGMTGTMDMYIDFKNLKISEVSNRQPNVNIPPKIEQSNLDDEVEDMIDNIDNY